MNKTVAAIAAIILLSACEARIGKDEESPAIPGNGSAVVSAEGKAKAGEFSLKAPGFDLKFDIPEGIAGKTELDGDSELFYPGATLNGMHIEGGKTGGAVELRFISGDAPDKVAAWYQDPARADRFTAGPVVRTGVDYVIEGTQKKDGDAFIVRLSPRAAGTDGRLIFTDRG